MPSPGKKNDSALLKYFLTITAASTAETLTYPIDITKTRLQIQGQSRNGQRHRGAVRTIVGILREEGVRSVYKGLSPALARQWVYGGSKVFFYEYIRDHILRRDENGNYALWKSILGGMVGGAAGQYLASPNDLVKIRMQMEGRRVLEGKSPRYTGSLDAFRSILKTEGVTGLWKGWSPNCQRAALVCLGDLTTYDSVKQSILRHTNLSDNAFVHTLSSVCSGLVSTILGTPADVMKSRMMNQPYVNGRGTLYKSTLDCFIKTMRQEGYLAVYKGFFLNWIRLAPWTLTFWLVYEEIRVLANVGNF